MVPCLLGSLWLQSLGSSQTAKERLREDLRSVFSGHEMMTESRAERLCIGDLYNCSLISQLPKIKYQLNLYPPLSWFTSNRTSPPPHLLPISPPYLLSSLISSSSPSPLLLSLHAFLLLFSLIFFETGFHVTQTGLRFIMWLKLSLNSWFLSLYPAKAIIADVHHHIPNSSFPGPYTVWFYLSVGF